MCGICGCVTLRDQLDPAVGAAIEAMTKALHHRGPDGEGYYRDHKVALGHRRLAIIDRAGGRQPMANEDESLWVIFNGEIYNHNQLRKTLLSKGHVFRTQSDTESIVHAYEEYGPACVEHLQGMFAFAIYDRRTGELFLARDRLGKKPLFYAQLGDALLFASEIKALRHCPLWDAEIDVSALEGFFSLGYYMAPGTAYRHVHKLLPGHWLLLRDGAITIRRYWQLEGFDEDRRTAAEVLEELNRLLLRATGDRLESEVPLGAFLSGGIDSGLVVSYMSEADSAGPTTISVGFGDADHNELQGAEETASFLGTRHHSEILEPDVGEVLDRIIESFDEPFADSSAVPTYFVCEMARRHVTVCLSGDGGDETFGGYDFRYIPHAWEDRIRRLLPGSAPRGLARFLGRNWPRSRRLPKVLRLGTILENLGEDPATAYFADLCFSSPRDVRALLGRAASHDYRESPVYGAVTEPYKSCPSASPIQRAQYADLMVYLPNDVLVKVDRMSMAHSLEVRCPLLDHRVSEFAFRLPVDTKMPALRCKHLLKTLAAERLPPAVLQRGKHGFTAPVARWISGPIGQQFSDQVLTHRSAISSYVDIEVLRSWFQEHDRGHRDRSFALWAAWVFERWLRLTGTRP